MGRYVFGTQGFSYEYVYGCQPANLHRLADWSGIEQGERSYALFTQFYAPTTDARDEHWDNVAGASLMVSVYQGAAPPYDLANDVESAIYSVCDRWKDVIHGLDAALPGTATNPDIGAGHSFWLHKSDWAKLATSIGHGASPTDPNSLLSAEATVATSGEDEYLPLLAVRALQHAVNNDMDRLELVDTEQRETNIWEVANDVALDTTGESWEDRYAFARLQSFLRRPATALYEALLAERPTGITAARALFADHLRDFDYPKVFEAADKLLQQTLPDDVKGELLMWRGDALCSQRRTEEGLKDAEAASALGFGALLLILQQDEENE